MNKIEELISSLNYIKDNYLSMAGDVLNENAEKIEELNLMTLYDGERPDGSQIEPFYSPFTVKEKKRKGQPYDRVTTNDTGAFYKGIKAKAFQNKFSMIGTDPKTKKLENKYGQLVGVGEATLPTVIEDILKPGLGQKMQEALPK